MMGACEDCGEGSRYRNNLCASCNRYYCGTGPFKGCTVWYSCRACFRNYCRNCADKRVEWYGDSKERQCHFCEGKLT